MEKDKEKDRFERGQQAPLPMARGSPKRLSGGLSPVSTQSLASPTLISATETILCGDPFCMHI